MFTKKTSLIIPTKDRPNQLIKLIKKLNLLNLKFKQIIIVDSSSLDKAYKIKNECIKKKINYYHTKASTAYQRNFGLKKVRKSSFVMFMDDDVIFFKSTFKEMNKCIKSNEKNSHIAGFGFNQVEKNHYNFFDNLKTINLFAKLNIYPSLPGMVSKSGWHSKILNLKRDIVADWVFTTICLYKFRDIKKFKFDESFGQYSYLEDLDFSLNLLKKSKKILLSSRSKFIHPTNLDRSGFQFGVTEIINRYKIVKKHKLSKKLFFIASLIRLFISLFKSFPYNKKYFLRSVGNIYGYFLLK